MNKKDFIDTIRQSPEFPCEIDLETVCAYLESKLPDSVNTEPDIFLQHFKLSFEIFRHINEAEARKHLEGLVSSIEDAIDSVPNSDTVVAESDVQAYDDNESTSSVKNDKLQKHYGIWQKICARNGSKKVLGMTAFFAAFILLLPIIGACAVLILTLYAVPIILATVIMLALLVPTISLAVLAIIALSYGISSLFTSVPIGIMESGLGTVLFSLSVALWALNLKFFTFTISFFVTQITKLISKLLSRPLSFVFGKEEI